MRRPQNSSSLPLIVTVLAVLALIVSAFTLNTVLDMKAEQRNVRIDRVYNAMFGATIRAMNESMWSIDFDDYTLMHQAAARVVDANMDNFQFFAHFNEPEKCWDKYMDHQVPCIHR